MKISTFIMDNMEILLQEWEDFAKTIFNGTQSKKILRDHAKEMLLAIAFDLQQEQPKLEQTVNNTNDLQLQHHMHETAAEEHGLARMEEGFTMSDIAAEYRALRANVMKRWGNANKSISAADLDDLVEFNEALDQSLNQSLSSYIVSKNSRDIMERRLSEEKSGKLRIWMI